ncbi:MAG: hypothetical protein AAFZ65_14245, partial [Planctomycetota bacterium]
AILLGACAVAGCLAPRADLEQRPTFGLHVAIADDYEVEQTVPETLLGGIPLDVQGIDGDVDYTSIELSIGATTYQYVGPATGADGRPVPEAQAFRRKLARLEARIGYADFEDADGTELQALELAAGGRAFTPINAGVAPYLGALPTVTIFEDASGISIGAQLGLRLAAGFEIDPTPWLTLDASVDYALPIVEIGPGDVLGEDADTEFEGAAIRFGVLITL